MARRESQLVLGLDPHPDRLWPGSGEGDERLSFAVESFSAALTGSAHAKGAVPARAAAAVLEHCRRLIDAAGPACVGVKPQLACFERLGAAGWLVLEAVCDHARARDLLVLADGKRGDVPVTATAYAQALLSGMDSAWGRLPGLGADALTVSPLLGADALEPLTGAARACSAGVFVLVRTSNPGAADVMDAPMADGTHLWERLAALVADAGRDGRGARSGLADVGAVTGATAPEHLERMRALMPDTPFLLPGIGAQGARVEDLGPAFAGGRGSALVTAARSIADAHEAAGGSPADAAQREAERLRAAAWSLA